MIVIVHAYQDFPLPATIANAASMYVNTDFTNWCILPADKCFTLCQNQSCYIWDNVLRLMQCRGAVEGARTYKGPDENTLRVAGQGAKCSSFEDGHPA